MMIPVNKRTYPIKLITWVRDPIERLISGYYYWKKLKYQGNPNHAYFLKHNFSLVEYAQLDFLKNEMLTYLGDVPITDFDFVGVMENYEQDMYQLAKLMNWRKFKIYHSNKGSKKRASSLTKSEIEKLKAIRKDEIELYNQVLSIRKLNIN